ncbi:restriction endonuclease subunit S [Psychrobacter sp. I-STPA10]|uniref:restriction endonuclease subunit S n=1 Tax=Psychrobacter sp. I-STPA10 TaxID=2585769 RepID=UPI001E5BF15C|nr:restriction endonuclease subunit S [Psychrobacter sp. I-STPA10]
MITIANFKDVLIHLGFEPLQNSQNIYEYVYSNHTNYITPVSLRVDLTHEKLIYPEDNGLMIHERQTCNFSQNENFVVFECVHRLLKQGYKPEHIELEPKWQLGHGASGGRADILIKNYTNEPLLIIECKTAGVELNRAWQRTLQDGGQLFSYVQQVGTTQFVSLYASDWQDDTVVAKYYLISVTDNPELLRNLSESTDENIPNFAEAKSKSVEDIYHTWQTTYQLDFATKGLFEADIEPYQVGKTKYNLDDLSIINSQDIQGKYHEFATILRQHNVSGRENAFDKLVNLFLCKIVDETNNSSNLHFYWKGISFDNPFHLQDRLQALYQYGMRQFLNEEVTYIKEQEVDEAFKFYVNDPDETQKAVKAMFRKLKFFTNNDFAFIDVHNQKLFEQNSAILLKIVQMLQDIRLKTNNENQFLGDMFEGFLDQGVKQSEGQFFTPMPIVKFIMSSLPLSSIIADSDDIPKTIDYACGAGHFLNEYAKSIEPIVTQDDGKILADYHSQITGIEKEYRLSKVAKVSAFMYGQDDINIIYADALAKNEQIDDNSYSVLVANPPYSVKGFLDTLSTVERRQYELIHCINDKSYANNNSIETFFIERSKQLLKTDGVAAIIVPSSILTKGKASSTSSSKNIYVATREILLKYFDIIAISEFGSGTFGKTGTNTVTLFLRRKSTKDPIDANHYAQRVVTWFRNVEDDRRNHIYADGHLIEQYCDHQQLNIEDYKTLLQHNPNETLLANEYFISYQKEFDNWSEIKNLKKRKSFKDLDKSAKEEVLRQRFIEYLIENEKDKLYYFILASLNATPVVIVKSPSKSKDMKTFLGYEWSSAKGNEGIKYLGQVKIEEPPTDEDSGEVVLEEEDKRVLGNLYNLNNINTPLYDPNDSDNPEKISWVIRQNFNQQDFDIPEELSDYVMSANLVDMLDFGVMNFNKSMSLTPKVELKIETKWELKQLGDIVNVMIGGTPPRDHLEFFQGNLPWLSISEMNGGVIEKTKENITLEAVNNSNVKLIPKGTTLLSFKLSIGKTAIAGTDIYTNEAIAGLIPKDKEKLIDNFVFQIFNSRIIPLVKSGLNTFGQSLNKSFLENSVYIPLPPLEVQQQIVDACQAIDNEVVEAKNIITQSKEKIAELFNTSLQDRTQTIRLSDTELFDVGIGKRVLANQIEETNKPDHLPVYSANVYDIFGYINDNLLESFDLPSVLWGIDGDWMTNYIPANQPFYPTDHCGYIRVKTEQVNPKYLTWILEKAGEVERFSRHYRASSERIKNLTLAVADITIQNQVIEEVDVLEDEINQAQNVIDTAHDRKQQIIKQYL